MSLESALAALTVAVEANTAALNGIKGAAKAATEAKTPATTGGAKADKPKSTKAKHATEEELRTAFGGYLSVKDKEERAERATQVGKILAHFEVAKATEIPEEKRAEAIGYVNLLVAGESLPFGEEEDEDDEEGSLI